jgi:oxygen-dependent protoporphyrinogen oxidase
MQQGSVAVIGGGMTGLVAARGLAERGCAVTLYEAADRLGGQVRTVDVMGHLVDVGAESLHLAGPNVDLLDELGLTDQLIVAESSFVLIWDGARRRRLPAGMGPAGPTRLWPIVRSGSLSPLGMARAALEPVLPASTEQRSDTRADSSVGSFITERFGAEVTDRLVDPVLGSLHAGDVDRLSLRAATPMLAAKAARNRSLLLGSARKGHAAPSFVTLPGGLSSLVDRILLGSEVNVRLGTRVEALERVGSAYALGTGSSERDSFDGVVVALPAVPAVKLLQPLLGTDAEPLTTLRTASVATVVVAWDAAQAASCKALRATGILTPSKAGTLMKASTFLSTKWPQLRDPDLYLFRLSAGRVGEDRLGSLSDEELVTRMTDELRDATGLAGSPVHAQAYRWPDALPQLEVGHLDKMATVRSALARTPGVQLAGGAYDGLGISSCVAAGRRSAEALIAELALDEEVPS